MKNRQNFKHVGSTFQIISVWLKRHAVELNAFPKEMDLYAAVNWQGCGGLNER
jgi:hypothetical protein